MSGPADRPTLGPTGPAAAPAQHVIAVRRRVTSPRAASRPSRAAVGGRHKSRAEIWAGAGPGGEEALRKSAEV